MGNRIEEHIYEHKILGVESGAISATPNFVGTGGISVVVTPGDPATVTIDGSAVVNRDWKEDEFNPSNDQITFVLSQTPEDQESVFFIINGIVYDDVEDYSVSGQTVTWTNFLFNIESSDHVVIKYT